MPDNTNSNLMKHGLGDAAVLRIAASLSQLIPHFDAKAFHRDAMQGIETLELKERVHHLIGILHRHYDMPFLALCDYLMMLPELWNRGKPQDAKAGFAAWPVIDYVAIHGLAHPHESFAVLERLTPLFTAEFAVRPFIAQYPALAHRQLLQWCEHESEHVRRLASEGGRPRLPWGMQLTQFVQEPAPLKALLQKLKTDPSLYVRRSVANNLNDISKDNRDWMIALCSEWKKDQHPHTDWIIKHAMRSLIKSGDARVFPLLGFTDSPDVSIGGIELSATRINMGDELQFSFALTGNASHQQQLVVDYVMYFMKANGKLAPKVFKLKSLKLAPNATESIRKKHVFKNISTRVYYAGKHVLAIHVNGKELARCEFDLC